MKLTDLKDLEEESAPPHGPGDAAMALGLERAKMGDLGLAADTAVYLRKQSQMLDLQMENLHEQRLIQLHHLKRRELIDRLKVFLQLLAIAVGALLVGLLAFAVWQASRSHALIIEPISATEDLGKRGLTSEVLATQLLDKLRGMQANTDSARAAHTYRSNWADDVKVEIPQTGVSIGELLRGLRRWLGHDVHISGETYKTAQGLALTTRVGDLPGETFTGADSELEKLTERAAESIYRNTQPYRYSVYLYQHGRPVEATAVMGAVAQNGPISERAWGLIGLGGQLAASGKLNEAAAATRAGLRLDPELAAGWRILAGVDQAMGHDEQVLTAMGNAVRRLKGRGSGGITPKAAAQSLPDAQATVAEKLGDYREGARIRSGGFKLQSYQFAGSAGSAAEALDRVLAHERIDAYAVKLAEDDMEAPIFRGRLIAASASVDGDWGRAVAALEQLQQHAAATPGVDFRAELWRTQVWPWQAYGYARVGRMADARALIAKTPEDCYLCLRMRARIAATAGDRRGRDAWFSRAIAAGPSMPFAYGEWGYELAQTGEHQRAEEQFKAARRRGPNWAEPLVWWGQSLSRQGKSRNAELRYAAAARLAPQWGQIARERPPTRSRAS